MNSQKITSLLSPTVGTDAANKSYTDNAIATTSSVGTITTGVWQGTPVGIQYGGTGATTAAAARAALFAQAKAFTVTVGRSDADYVCDGTNDDVELQQAIAACIAAGGGTIWVKRGTYNLSTNLLIIGSDIIFRGEGWRSTNFVMNNEVNREAICVGDASTACNNVSFLDFGIDGNKANQTGSVYSGGTRNLIRYRSDAQNSYGGLVQGVHTYNGKQNGISSESHSFLTIRDNVSENCDNFGVWWENGSQVIVEANHTRNNVQSGIKVLSAGGGSVSHNDSKGDRGGMSFQSVGNVAIIGNSIYRSGWAGASTYATNGVGMTDVTNATFSGNQIFGAYANGLEMYGCNRVKVVANGFHRNGQFADNTYADIKLNSVGTANTENVFEGNTFNNEQVTYYSNRVAYNMQGVSGSHYKNIIANNIFGTPGTAKISGLANTDGTAGATDNIFGTNENLNPHRYYSIGYLSGSHTLDWANGDVQVGSGYNGTTTLDITSGLFRGQKLWFRFGQDTGNKVLAYGSSIEWPGGTIPPISTAASAFDAFMFIWTGAKWTGYWSPNIAKLDARYVNTAGSTMTGFLTLSADPTSPMHAATKQYVDAARAGLDVKASVRAATTAALPTNTLSAGVLTASANAALAAQDGVTLVVNDRLLVKNEASGAKNGLYTVTQVGSGALPYILTRTTVADVDVEVTSGMFTFVTEGTVNGDKGFVLTTDDPITVNTTALTFSQFSTQATAWGAITGTLSAQTDLQTALNNLQPLDSDLTTIAGLTATTDNIIQSKAGAWASRTVAQFKTDLTLVKADVGLGNVDNTSDATKNSATATLTNKRITDRMVTLTDGANIATNSDNGDTFILTIAGNRTMDNPTGTPTDGQQIMYRVKQDATGSRTLAWGSAFRGSTDLPLPSLSTAASTEDYIGFQYNLAATKWDCLAVNKGF